MKVLHALLRRVYFQQPRSWDAAVAHALLYPFTPLYALGRRLHQAAQRARSRRLDRPVFSVGNLSVGGTGKTAFVVLLIAWLREMGWTPAVLKRGQGRREGLITGPMSPEETVAFGDEIALIHQRHPEVPLGVGADRHATGTALLQEIDVDCFLLDDGFQHLRLERDLDVVLIGSAMELRRGQLPAGPLREPLCALRRADYVSVQTDRVGSMSPCIREVPEIDSHPAERRLTHGYQFAEIRVGGVPQTERFRGERVDLLSMLARPGTLVEFLRAERIRVRHHWRYPDHDPLPADRLPEDLDPERTLVTEKEWVKLPGWLRGRVGVIRSELRVFPQETLKQELRRRMEQYHDAG